MDRRAFLASLRESPAGQTDASARGQIKKVGGTRSEYLASLKDASEASAGTSTVAPVAQPSIVSFSLEGLQRFKSNMSIAAGYNQQRPQPRVRPNYDNRKRKFYANPEVRQRHLRPQIK